LALGALFQNLDARDLPLFASLLDDRAPTLLYLTDETGAGGMSSSEDQESPQSVEGVASAMLKFWGVPASDRSENRKWLVEKKDFNRWAKQNFEKISSQPKPERRITTSEMAPELALYQADTKHILANLQVLPANARAWATFYLYRSSYGNYVDERALRQAALVAFKELGHEEVIRILGYNRDDQFPEIQSLLSESFKDDPLKAQFFGQVEAPTKELLPLLVQHFILYYGRELLVPEDVPFLLAGPRQPVGSFISSFWIVAAAEVAHRRSPAESKQIITKAMKQYSAPSISDTHTQAMLQDVLWRTEGMKASAELIEWFHTTPNPGSLLSYVERAAIPDTHELLTAIVADKRFYQTKSYTLAALLRLANQRLPLALISSQEIQAYLNRNDPVILTIWRERLRQHFSMAGTKPGK
jgi:hypothetical protein